MNHPNLSNKQMNFFADFLVLKTNLSLQTQSSNFTFKDFTVNKCSESLKQSKLTLQKLDQTLTLISSGSIIYIQDLINTVKIRVRIDDATNIAIQANKSTGLGLFVTLRVQIDLKIAHLFDVLIESAKTEGFHDVSMTVLIPIFG
jgi:hypothetical protein